MSHYQPIGGKLQWTRIKGVKKHEFLHQSARTAAVAAENELIVDLRGMWIGLAVLNVFYLIVRVYEQISVGAPASIPSRRNFRPTG